MAQSQNTQSNNDTGNIDLMGWDTVFAISLDGLNSSIVAQKTTPPKFNGTGPQAGATVSGTWNAWSVTGGEGDGIYLNCPVNTGTLTIPGMNQPYTLDGGSVTVEITLAVNDSNQQLADKTAKAGTGKTKVFQANATSSDPFQQPKVQKVQFTSVTGLAVYAAQDAFQGYFNANLGDFQHVFSAVCLEEEAVDAGKQWLKPYQSLYALASPGTDGGQTPGQSYFGILSLTSPPSQPLPQQNFDLRMFDFFTKTTPPTNSVFAISATLSMQNIVLQSAQHCVKGATVDDFEITNNGITVTNKNTLNWGDFQWDKDNPSSTVTPVISPNNFQLSLDGGNFHLSISQAAFTTPDGTCDVKLSADQYFNMGATKLSDGKYYFTPDPGLGTNSIRADCTANKGFEIFSIIEGIVTSVAFAFMGSALGEALGDAISSSTSSATEGAIEATEDAIQDGVDSMSEEAAQEATDSALEDATDAIESSGENSGGKTGMFANKFKVWGGVLGGMFGIPVSLLPQIMTMIYNDKITEGNVPTVDDFATNFTGAVQWPEVTSWQVTGGTFASAFLLSGHASS
jgi:hypothetical protein